MAYWEEISHYVQPMAKILKLLKKPSTIGVMLLCVVIAAGLYYRDRNKVWKHSRTPTGIWTITMDGKTSSYTFRGPLATFQIHPSQVTSRRKLTADMTNAHFLSMEWHYESGQPWVLWAIDNDNSRSVKKEVKLYATVDIVSADTDAAANAKSVYLERKINNPNPAQAAKPMGKVWNNTASKFEDSSSTYYLIEDRERHDGQVITCDEGATYCSLRGAQVTETLRFRNISVLMSDVANWKQYQDKARSLVQQIIVDNHSTK